MNAKSPSIANAVSDVLPPPDPIEGLASELYWHMERLEPTSELEWADLDERQRQFYRLVIEGLLENKRLVERAVAFANNDVIERCAKLGE